ncbi:MAG: hypothetical protein BroJett040_18350 [Oligoflexia bacterium]|nr:MAG: hypothetical protein BroJett040_18350 [Oligoflexia bacterium]
MKKTFLTLALCLICFNGLVAQASDFTGVLGFRSDSAQDVQSRTGYNVGALAFMDMAEKVALRAGFIYTQRAYGITSGSTELGDAKMTYFDVPVGLMFKFSDLGGVFLGGVMAMNVGKDCSTTLGNVCDGLQSNPYGWQMGVSFKFHPQLGGEMVYESLSKVTTNIKENKAAIINLKVYFE